MCLLTTLTVKKLNFKNPRWQTAAILKTVQSPYLCKDLSDFDVTWHADAEPVFLPHRLLKIQNF